MSQEQSTPPKIELRHLRYFLAAAEEMNFGRAALRLGIAQPGLSQQIMALERLVGTRLFDRSRRAVRLTLAGELLAKGARETLVQADRAILAARQAGRGEIGRIAIGYVGSAAYTGMLTRITNGFRGLYPQVELAVAETEMAEQMVQLSEGRLDIGFIRPPVAFPLGVTSVEILREPLLLAIPATHALAAHPRVSLAAFDQEVFITPRHAPDVSFHKYTVEACQAAGFIPRIGPQGRDFVTIVSMVSIGSGVALVPRSASCLQLPDIRFAEIEGPPSFAELAVAYRRGELSAAVRAFAQHARSYQQLSLRSDKHQL